MSESRRPDTARGLGLEGAVKDSIGEMLDEIAAGLRAGDEDVRDWLRDQLEEAGADEIVVELTMGVIARLMPRGQANTAPFRSARRYVH